MPDCSGVRKNAVYGAHTIIGAKVSVAQRYYICSFDRGARVFADAVRRHWGIENSLHWVLDMSVQQQAT